MNGLIATLLDAPSEMRLFRRGDAWITAGDVRTLAMRAELPGGDAPIFLHTSSAAHFCAGLLAVAAEHRSLALPAHTQETYLAEIGARGVTDDRAIAQGQQRRQLDSASPDPLLTFFTSGSTGQPKPVEKNLSRLETEGRTLDSVWRADAAHVMATVSHQHIYGLLFRIMWPLLSGRTADDSAATYWEDLAGKLAGATLISSPAHLTRLPPRSDLFALPPGLVFSSGQLLPFDAAQACIATFGAAAIEVLGSTETGGIAWRKQIAADTPWTPFPRVDILRDDDGALSVRSPNLQTDSPQATGDNVELLEGGAFRLKPRGDRIVKIDGKRVSLTRVEEALTALPEIAAAAAFTLPERGEALAAVVALRPAGQSALKALGAFRFSRQLRAALSATLEPAERPKHWRFPDALPTDAQGKRVLSALRALFAASSPLDALDIETRAQSETEAELAFTLPDDLIFFEGHFPNRAILPGVAQVHLAALLARRLWDEGPADANLARLKFRRVLLPGDAVVLKLKRDAKIGRVSFAYHFRDIIASEGEIGGLKS